MLTGLDALRHGVNHHLAAPLDLVMLAERLRVEGYKTIASTGGGLAGRVFGLAQGFDEFYSYPGWPGGFGELDTEMELSLAKLERIADQPFFLFFHTYEVHDPYQERAPFSDRCFSVGQEKDYLFGVLPKPRQEQDGYVLNHQLVKWRQGTPISSAVPVGKTEVAVASCLYDSGIAYADSHIENYLHRLDELDLLDTSMVILTSDHGEALGEHGLFKHGSLYEDNLKIPLIVSVPGVESSDRFIEEQVRTVDILPTILDVVGIDPEGPLDGDSLLPIIEGRVGPQRREAWSYAANENRGLSLRIDNRLKYIFNNSGATNAFGTKEMYDLQADPDELENLAEEESETARRLLDRMGTASKEARWGSARAVFENGSCDRLIGAIEMGALATEMKAFVLPEGSLIGDAEHKATLLVRRGETVEIFFESARPLVLRLRPEGCDSMDQETEKVISLSLGTIEQPRSFTTSPRGWSEIEGAVSKGPSSLVRVLFFPPSHVGVDGPGEVSDPQTLEQLRSLGYVQ